MESISVRDPTDVANARRRVGGLAARLGYDETAAGRVAIVVTELSQNVLRHGGGGEILARAEPGDGALGVAGGLEIMALDRGRGMADVAACLRDGYSTGGTSGTGLGAVQRLARRLLIHSTPPNGGGNGGTAVLVRIGGGAMPAPTAAALCVPKSGETVCGDTAAIVTRPDGSTGVMLADGLGHGPLAAAASGEAARLFRKYAARAPAAVLAELHAGLRSTRGAAVAVAAIDPRTRHVIYSGIGNIAGFVFDSAGVRRMVSHSGTAGHAAGRLQDFRYPLHNRAVVVMFSDGLATSWSPESHPGLFALDPLLIAGVLYRDHARGRDDASVVVWKG
jgi:anti-sigma regulatory factor (Ser/Thr protein kinase)